MLKARILSVLLAGIFLLGVTRASGSEDPKKLIEGAKKEGKVVYWASGMSPRLVQALQDGFKKKYGLKEFEVTVFQRRTTEIISLVTQELRVGRLSADIISGGIPVFYYDLLKMGELMKYDSPEYRHFERVGGWSEPGYWVMTGGYSSVMMWNPKRFKKGLSTYDDLLDPQLKGMICSADATKVDAPLYAYLGLRKILNKDFFVKLAKQDVVFFTRVSEVPLKIVTGEFLAGFLGSNRAAYVAASEGGDIKVTYSKEGEVLQANPLVILSKAPHPNAAKLLIDYIHSFEGQKLMVDIDGYQTGRKDIPIPPKVLEFSPRVTQMNVISTDWKSLTQQQIDSAREEFREIFKK
jgi:iron(III) transport system substrate-binding protein